MKFICYKDKMIKAINSVVRGVSSKTTMPILEGILIQTNDNNDIKLTCYDQELGIEYIIKDYKDCREIIPEFFTSIEYFDIFLKFIRLFLVSIVESSKL